MLPLFITGAPRSGTTHLMTILNRHPEICLTNEARVVHFLSSILYDDNIWENREALNAQKDIFRPLFLRGLQTAVRDYHLSFAKAPVKYWGDKMPHLRRANYFRAILELYPDARVINIHRDPRSVVASLTAKGWVNLQNGTKLWRDLTEAALEYERVMGENFLSVFYEELCKNRIGVTKRCLKFLGLKMESDLANWLEMEKFLPTLVSGPTEKIGTPAAERLLPVEAWYVVAQCRELMDALGYSTREAHGD